MSARISVPGISHGDKVKLTGALWGGIDRSGEYDVDDETFHRPAIYDREGMHWYIFETGFSVTKVEV